MKLTRLMIISSALSTLTLFAADELRMETREFKLSDRFYDVAVPIDPVEDNGKNKSYDSISDENTKAFFTELGVNWPEGSSFTTLAGYGEVKITNTPANIQLINDIFNLANLTPSLIEIRADFVEFQLKDIDKLACEDNISSESLHALWKNGKGHLLNSGRALTKSGQEASVKAVTECIYPTEFSVKPRKAPANPDANAPASTVEHQNYEMRETGNILQVVPEQDICGTRIRLITNPQHVSPPEWKNYSLPDGGDPAQAGQPAMPQPFFHVYSLSTQAIIANGATIVLGGGLNDAENKNCVYVFLTAGIVDMQGKQISTGELDCRLYNTEPIQSGKSFETRYIPVDPASMQLLLNEYEKEHKQRRKKKDNESFLKEYFNDHDIDWVAGSFIKYFPNINQIKITNTPGNIQKFTQALYSDNAIFCQIETRLDFVKYAAKDINTLLLNGDLSVTSLKNLWKQNRAHLLSSSHVISVSGMEAVTKGVTEYIYPTEFEVKTAVSTNATDSVVIAPVVEPQNFEMREVGNIFQIVPEVSMHHQNIHILLNPQLVSHPLWKNYGTRNKTKEIPMEQPFFPVQSVSTQVTISNGATLLLGGGAVTPGEDSFVFTFLSSRLVDVNGKPVQVPESLSEKKRLSTRSQDDKTLIKREYNVYSACYERVSTESTESFAETSDEREEQSYNYKEFFSELGMKWPKGSQLEYDSTRSCLIVINTYDNLELFEKILMKLNGTPRMVSILTECVEYSTADINGLAKDSNISVSTLRKLWKEGKGKLLSSPYVLTKSGQEAITKGVIENIYPTEFKVKSTVTPSGTIDIVEPLNFEMRETGDILQVVPEVTSEGNLIALLLNPQRVQISSLKQYDSNLPDAQKSIALQSMNQPFFQTYSTSTQIKVDNGATILLSSGTKNSEGDKTTFVFATAQIVDPDGKTLTTGK